MLKDRLLRNVRGLRFWITCKIKIEAAHSGTDANRRQWGFWVWHKGQLISPTNRSSHGMNIVCWFSRSQLHRTRGRGSDGTSTHRRSCSRRGPELRELNFYNVDEACLPSAPQEDIISLVSSCPLYKHPWKGSPEQKSSQCLTWKMSRTVRDKSSPDRICPEKAERAKNLHLE